MNDLNIVIGDEVYFANYNQNYNPTFNIDCIMKGIIIKETQMFYKIELQNGKTFRKAKHNVFKDEDKLVAQIVLDIIKIIRDQCDISIPHLYDLYKKSSEKYPEKFI